MKLFRILNVTSVLVMTFSLHACTDLVQTDGAPAVDVPPVVAAPVAVQPVKKVKPPFPVVLPGAGGGGWS